MNKIAVAGIVLLATFAILSSRDATAHDFWHDDGCAPGTTSDGYFWAGGPVSGWATLTGVGWGSCLMWTLNNGTCCSPDQFAEWYLPTNSNYNHTYRLLYYNSTWTQCPGLATTYAHYHSYPNGTDGGIGTHRNKNQSLQCNGYCNLVASNQMMNGSNGGKAQVWDSTLEPPTAYYVLVDAFCFYQ